MKNTQANTTQVSIKKFSIGGIIRELSFADLSTLLGRNYKQNDLELIWYSAGYDVVNNLSNYHKGAL